MTQSNQAKDQDEVPMHVLKMKGAVFLEKIATGEKPFEGRVNTNKCAQMNVGDKLKLFDHEAEWGIVCLITSKDIYSSFEEMLKDKGVLKMLPQLQDMASRVTQEELLTAGVNIYKQFPGAENVHKLGCAAIGVRFLQTVT